MLIVLDGPDGTGKTTLAKIITQAFPKFQYLKPVPSSGPGDQTGSEMIDWMMERFKEIKKGTDYVMDRINLVSEEIYGPICRGVSLFDHKQIGPAGQMRVVDALSRFFGLNPIMIYCRPEREVIFKNLGNESFQMAGVRENIVKIIEAYDNFMAGWEKAGVEIYKYDYTRDLEAEEVLKYIKGIIGDVGTI